MSSGISNISLAIFSALMCTSYTISLLTTYWSESSKAFAQSEATYEHRGLWTFCVGGAMGGSGSSDRCQKQYPSLSINQQPTWLVYNQFTMVIAAILTALATVTSIAGHPCLSKFNLPRATLNIVTGVVLMIAGGLTLVGTSWAVNACQNNYVTLKGNSFSNFSTGGGMSIMAYTVGWSCILAMISSILCLLVCGYAFKKYFDAKNEERDHGYAEGEDHQFKPQGSFGGDHQSSYI